MFRCWNCGADNNEEAETCFICGFRIQWVRQLLDELENVQRLKELLQGAFQYVWGEKKFFESLCEEMRRKHLQVDEGTYCPECGAPVLNRAMYCWQCGYVVRPVVCPNQMCLAPQLQDASFCDYCGTALGVG